MSKLFKEVIRVTWVRGQIGVTRDGFDTVWFNCPAEDALATAEYIGKTYNYAIDYNGPMGKISANL